MTDTPTPAVCVLCPDRERIPYRGLVCDACRSWLAGILGDIRILVEQVTEPEPVVRDDRTGTFTARIWRKAVGWVTSTRDGWRDPIAFGQPAAPIPAPPAGPRVSTNPAESRPPIRLDAVDLAYRSNPGSVGPHTRGILGDDDQVGTLPVATALEAWAAEWIAAGCPGNHLPLPTVDTLTRWLADRVDWACDEYDTDELVEFAAQMRSYRSALRWTLGLSDRPEYKHGVACPKCGMRTLYRQNASVFVECGSCPTMLSPQEYAELTGKQATDATRPEPA